MKSKMFFVIAGLVSYQTNAVGIAQYLNVTQVRVDKSGKGYVKFSSPLTSSPASCGNAHPNHLAFDVNTPSGQGIMSLALSAHATGKKIYAKGTGTCPEYGSVESWDWGLINN